jgi:CRP-like cAMP-binding protein
MKNLILELEKADLFTNKTKEELQNLITKIEYKFINAAKNEYVFNSLTSTKFIGIVLSGKVNVERILPYGKLILMYTKKSGDMFGEVAVFSEANHYPCNVVAKEDSSILLISKNEFFKLLTLDNIILENFLKIISNKAFQLNSRVEALSFVSTKQKVAFSLLNDFHIEKDLLVKLPFSKKMWADKLNISRASLYKTLEELCIDSIISMNQTNLIEIINSQKLEDIVLN